MMNAAMIASSVAVTLTR